jgi:phosphate transport system permease protein
MSMAPPANAPAPRGHVTIDPNWSKLRKANNIFRQALCVLAAAVAVAALLFVLGYLLVEGLGSMHLSLLTQGPTPMGEVGGGIRNAIVGTLILLAIASCVGLPLGILGGVYQLEARGPFASTVRFLTDVLNSIPSIVIGIFVYVLVVLPTARMHPGYGFSALAGGIALGFLMIPTVMRTTEEILRLVPNSMREASLALGAARWRTMFSIILPAARGGIVTGVMLALSRVAGETAPLLFTAFGNLAFNMDIRKPIDALPLTIFNDATSPYGYLHAQALAGAILLILMILVMSLAARYATRGVMAGEK